MITVDFNRLYLPDSSRLAGYRILDIGCGEGRHTCAAFRMENVVVIGADLNFEKVFETKTKLILQEKLGEGAGAWGICVADITCLPFEDNFFDMVICSEVLEHIHDQKSAIAETIRVLKPNKNLIVSVPRYLPERICWALSAEYKDSDNGHVRIYRKKKLISLLESLGVKQWGFHYAHSLHTPYWWLKCLVGPKRDDCNFVNLYHRLLVWDMMKGPWVTRFLDRLLNPVLGKSIVIYLRKENITAKQKTGGRSKGTHLRFSPAGCGLPPAKPPK